jgi:hypothetical protein
MTHIMKIIRTTIKAKSRPNDTRHNDTRNAHIVIKLVIMTYYNNHQNDTLSNDTRHNDTEQRHSS